jgi:hypothetical protein
MKGPVLLTGLAAVLFTVLASSSAQDYKPFSPACVVDGGEAKPGWTAQYKYEGKWYVVGFCCPACRTKFIQAPASYMPAALEAEKARLAKADKKVSPDATGPCDLKKLVKGSWCVECARDLGRDDLHNGVCKKCEKKPVQIEYCVKTGAAEDRARVTYQCKSCGAASDVESAFKHEDGCTQKLTGLKKICSKSGMAPHATDVK